MCVRKGCGEVTVVARSGVRLQLVWNRLQRVRDRPQWELRRRVFFGNFDVEVTSPGAATCRERCAGGAPFARLSCRADGNRCLVDPDAGNSLE